LGTTGKTSRKSRVDEKPRYRPFEECLWCGKTPLPKPTLYQINFFCNKQCSMTAMRCIRMTGLSRQRGGAGIQGVHLGLLMQTLHKAGTDGITAAEWLSQFYTTYRRDWGKRITSRGLPAFLRNYIQSKWISSYDPPSNKDSRLYYFEGGTCLREWLKPKYVGWLDEYYDSLK